MNLSLLIHSFSKYSFLWEGQTRAFKEWWPIHPPLYLGSDFPVENDIFWYNMPADRSIIYSGPGEWSDRLRVLLKQIPTDYVLYMQEDHYPTRNPPNLAEIMQIMEEKQLFRLQISPIVHFYTLFSEENTIYFDVKSKYLVSHQPSIWRKSFLLSCLKSGETPWVNEYKGTLRLQESGAMRDYITKKIAIYPYDWFSHKCVKGVVQ